MLSRSVKRNIQVFGGCKRRALHMTIKDELDIMTYSLRKKLKKFLFNMRPKHDSGIEATVKPNVVILGTGWGALSFLHYLDQDDFNVTIVSPRSFFFYTPLLAGTASGTVRSNSIMEPIRWYINRAGHTNGTFIQASCNAIDIETQKLFAVDIRGKAIEIDYDYLLVAVGAEPATFGIPGVKENAIFMKEVEDGMKVQKQILERLEAANSILLSRKRGNEILDNSKEYGLLKNADLLKMDHMTKEEMDRFNERYNEYSQIIKKNDEDDNKEIEKLLHWVIIGGGPTGVELVAEISDFVREDASKYFPLISKRVKITLLEAGEKILSNFDSSLSTYARTQLESRGAEVLCGTMVTKITKDFVEIKQEIVGKTNFLTTQIPYGCIIWAGGIATRPITKAIAVQIGDTQSSRWGLEVDAKLKVKGVESDKIWALGDCAVCGLAPTAQTASQQGKYLGKMFRDTKLQIKEVEKYPDFSFKNKGSLAYLGNGKGIAEIKGLWDQYPTDETNRVEGHAAFAIWRSLYFSKLMSSRNQAAVAFDWVKTSIFGRDISTTHNIDTST